MLTKTKEMCADCGKVFYAGKYSYFCPDCRSRRLRESAKRRGLNKMGNDAYSKQCAIRRKEGAE